MKVAQIPQCHHCYQKFWELNNTMDDSQIEALLWMQHNAGHEAAEAR